MLLSEIDGSYTFEDKGRRFTVEVEPGEHMLLVAGCHWGSAASRFTHPGVAGKLREVYHFKHYTASGGKWWTSRPGVSLLFLVPKSRIALVEEATYSYVRVSVGECRYTLNVSGGTGGQGWTDWVRSRAHISVGHPVRELRILAEKAVRCDALPAGFHVPTERPEVISEWERLVRDRELWGALSRGDRVATRSGRVYFFVKRPSRKQHVLASDREEPGSYGVLWRICRKDIDWERTAELRGQT